VTSDPHSAFRREVRERALAEAKQRLSDAGWEQVRISQIAAAVGVSRPTIYAEFGNKDGLAEALIMAETTGYLTGAYEILSMAGTKDPVKVFVQAVAYTMKWSEESPVLHAVLTSGTSGSDSLLPFITTRSEPIMAAATELLHSWFREHAPGTSKQELADGVDTMVRMVVSHLVVPDTAKRSTPAKFGRIALLLFPRLATD